MKPKVGITAWLAIAILIIYSCKDNESATPDCAGAMQVTANAIAATCGTSDGKISVSATGGVEPHQFSINGTDFQSSADFASLAAGKYTVTAKDKNNCTATSDVNVDNSSDIAAAYVTTLAGCGSSEGAINITASGGTGAHSYSLDGTTFQSSPSFSNLSARKYMVTVKDESGCSQTSEVQVQSGISYGKVIQPIIAGNCAVSGCHVQGGQSPNFTIFSNVKSSASKIKSKTADKSMPKEGSLTAEQIQQIACWVDDGALEN